MKKLMMCLVIVALAIPVMADEAFSYGVAITSAGDTMNIRASYKLYEVDSLEILSLKMTDVSIHGDALWAIESERWGAGISARARTIGIPVIDKLLDTAHVDGVGVAGILRDSDVSFKNIEWCLYAVSDIKF